LRADDSGRFFIHRLDLAQRTPEKNGKGLPCWDRRRRTSGSSLSQAHLGVAPGQMRLLGVLNLNR